MKSTDGAARAETKLALAMPSRDRGRQGQPMEQRRDRCMGKQEPRIYRIGGMHPDHYHPYPAHHDAHGGLNITAD